jgi:hypothetical protein
MPKIFDRDDPTLISIYDRALAIWESSGDEEKSSLAINLRCDHRVTDEREARFRDYFLRHYDLREALDNYVKDQVKFASYPHFCETWCNNLVADCEAGFSCEDFNDGTDLVTVISLNGLARAIKDTNSNLIDELPEWKDIIDSETQASDRISDPTVKEDRFDTWLETNIKDKTLTEIEGFLTKLFKVLNYRLKVESQHYNPVWVATWDKFADYIHLGPDRWNQVVGVPRYTPTWQIVIKYHSSKVKCLYRPSQLDGGYFPQHFPSPRETVMAAGGLTMDLGDSQDQLLVNEYIHEQIELDINYWISAGRVIGKTGITPASLEQVRASHYNKLLGQYGETAIRDWMPRPN